MRPFDHVYAENLDHAAQLLSASPNRAMIVAGGSDLLGMMKDRLAEPSMVINLQKVKGIDAIQVDSSGVRIGGMARLRELERNKALNERYAALAKAAGSVASPPIRNVATVGGNLAQRSRCWYFRGPFDCWLKGGTECFAVEGENRYHAIFGNGPCYMVQASDLATALYAMNGVIRIVGSSGVRDVAADEFFVNPTDGSRHENVLKADEIVAEVIIPPLPQTARSGFLKATQRAAWDAAIVSIAYVLVEEEGVCRDARIALGGVATTPVRALAAEKELVTHALSSDVIGRAAKAVTEGARCLAQNAYKLPLLEGCLKSALYAEMPPISK